MSQNGQPQSSLLSLSVAAANAVPIPAESAARSSQGATTNTTKHRRLSSAGRSRRRLSDARDAATRPFPASLQTASTSLAALSLSSPTPSHRPVPGPQPIQVPRATSTNGTSEPELSSVDDTHLSVSPPQSHTPLAPNSVNVVKSGRKRGTIFTCESCSKVYRHPSCLIKHRWEHTPQWREASKFVLSKHQQVQLLEAAAILSHLSPSSASLPEDRSLWPSFLSGGLVPPPVSVSNSDVGLAPPQTTTTTTATSPPGLASASASNVHTLFPISSSVPASTMLDSYRAGLTGPRLHDYAIGEGGISVTHVRPGMLGVPTAPMSVVNGKSSPMLVPAQTAVAAPTTTEDDALNLLSLREASVTPGSWGSPTSASLSHSHSRSFSHAHAHSHSHSHSLSYSHSHSHSHSLSLPHASKERERRRSNGYEYGFVSRSGSGSFGHAYAPDSNGGWSLPSSSVRSKGSSGSGSRSQSGSESRSDDEDEGMFEDGVDLDVDLDGDGDMGVDLEDVVEGGARVRRGRVYGSHMRAWEGGVTNLSVREDAEEEKDGGVGKGAEQTWDGMEMEMEMD